MTFIVKVYFFKRYGDNRDIHYELAGATGFMQDVINNGVWIDGKILYPPHKINRVELSEEQ